MALSKLVYQPNINGAVLDTHIKSSCMSLDASRDNVGLKVMEATLEKLYEDFSLTLKTSILNYLNQATIIFPGTGPINIIWGPLDLNIFKSKIKSTAALIDSNIKSQSQGKPPNILGKIRLEILYEKIFIDVCDIISQSISISGNSSIVTITPGAIAPPHAGTVAPVPATLQTQYDANLLKSLLSSSLNLSTAKLMSSTSDSDIKSKCSNKHATECGKIVHDVFIKDLSEKLTMELEKHIKTFITLPRYIIPLGTPGVNPGPPPPILPTAAPIFGTVS